MAEVIRAGYLTVAMKLQEASDGLMHGDVCARLRDALADLYKGSGKWANYIDHSGDGESGDVIYSCDGECMKAPYEITEVGGKAVTHIDTDEAVDVVPRTTYEEEADDDDQYAGMEESYKRQNLYTSLPLYERFISKDERAKADAGDFAGKGKSFPILQPGDVMAAVRSMGRAGSENYGTSGLKSRIIAIAKKKGWTKYLPKAWQDGDSSDTKDAKESKRGKSLTFGPDCGEDVVLVESAATLEAIVLKEAKADYEIKLIAPGKGSSAFYPAEVLKRDGPKVFKKETHVYLNHPTAAEEAARPENKVENLAGVLTTDAVYHESHASGPGLYARMKVFADHGQMVEEKAPHVGMSIRASGVAEANRRQDGLPVLKELTGAESVDVVTKAGAGGMILSEAARSAAGSEEVEMTEADVKRLIDSATKEATAPLRAKVMKGDALVEANAVLSPLALRETAKQLVVRNVMRMCEDGFPEKDGELDTKKFGELVMAEAKAVAAALGEPAAVRGMGAGLSIAEDGEKSVKKQLKEAKRARQLEEMQQQGDIAIFESLGMPKDAAQFAAKGRAE